MIKNSHTLSNHIVYEKDKLPPNNKTGIINRTNKFTSKLRLSRIGNSVNERSKKYEFSDYVLHIGLFIILFIFSTVTVSTLLFFIHIPITSVSLFLGLGATTGIYYLWVDRNLKHLLYIITAVLVLLCISIGISSLFYDPSEDGNAYHKVAVGMLESGWNPLYETSVEALDRLGINIPGTSVWADYYPKASWIFSSTIYALTEIIESGKCYHLLGIISLFCVGYAYLSDKTKMTKWQIVLCSSFLSVNTVSLSQLASYYLDGFLGSLLLIYIISLFYLAYDDGKQHRYRYQALILIFTTAVIGMNLKYSGNLLFGIFGILFYGYCIYRLMKKSGWKENKNIILKLTGFFAILVLFALLFIGSTSYGTNTINYGTPLYYGSSDTLSIVNDQLPQNFQNLSIPEMYIYSIFSPSAGHKAINLSQYSLPESFMNSEIGNKIYTIFLSSLSENYEATAQFKIPFTFSLPEIIVFCTADTRISGWGIMYSGLFIIGLLCIILTCILARRRDDNLSTITALFCMGVILPGFVIPGLWWARYYAPMFLIPVFALIFLFVISNDLNEENKQTYPIIFRRITKALPILLCVILFINIGPSLGYTGYNILDSHQTWIEMEELNTITQTAEIEIYDNFNGEYFNIIDNNIKYTTYSGTTPQTDMKQALSGLYYHIKP